MKTIATLVLILGLIGTAWADITGTYTITGTETVCQWAGEQITCTTEKVSDQIQIWDSGILFLRFVEGGDVFWLWDDGEGVFVGDSGQFKLMAQYKGAPVARLTLTVWGWEGLQWAYMGTFWLADGNKTTAR